MITIAMCDDEINIAKSLSKIIESQLIKIDFDAKIEIVTDDQQKIYELIKNKKIDVLILDVDFKGSGKNGIDFAHELRSMNKDFYLVFLSAHSRYIHMSLINKTFDYLIKPVHPNSLMEFLLRLKEEFEHNKKVFMKINNSLLIRTDSILYIEKQGNRANIYTTIKTYNIMGSINDILDMLPNNFKKCHRSYIINENKILSIDKKNNCIYLENNCSCPIGSNYSI